MEFDSISLPLRLVLRSIRERKPLEEIVTLILESACELVGAVHGSFITVDHVERRLKISSTTGPDWTAEKRDCQLSLDEGITGRVARTGQPVLCGSTSLEKDYYPLFEYVRSELTVPVIVDNRVWGIINLDGLEEDCFSARHLATLSIFADLTSSAITLRLEMLAQEKLQRELSHSQKLASLGRIIANIAHEINNPLTAILGHSSLVKNMNKDPELDRSIAAIVDQSERTANLVLRLLSFSRNEVVELIPCTLEQLISDILNALDLREETSRCRLTLSHGDPEAWVSVSIEQMQQVIGNLIVNASQAFPAWRRDGVIHISTHTEQNDAVIEVDDNGVGIEPAVLNHIFEPFFTTKPVGMGTGLGLSIAQTIVGFHGGTLSVQSRVNHGTCFSIRLPLASKAPRRSPSLPSISQSTGSVKSFTVSPSALIIDDEPTIVEALTGYFQSLNLIVEGAPDGHFALDRMKLRAFDIVISDLRMTGLDGLQVYELARQIDPAYADRFIFITGDFLSENVSEKINATSCPCLQKPFSLTVLRDTVMNRLELALFPVRESAGGRATDFIDSPKASDTVAVT